MKSNATAHGRWIPASILLLVLVVPYQARAFDSAGAEMGNVERTLPAHIPTGTDPFVQGNCGVTGHRIDPDFTSCNTEWALRHQTFNYVARTLHSDISNFVGEYTDQGGMARGVLLCDRPVDRDAPVTDLANCKPSGWGPGKLSDAGWVKTRHAWNLPAAGDWDHFVTPEHLLITQNAAKLAGFDATFLHRSTTQQRT